MVQGPSFTPALPHTRKLPRTDGQIVVAPLKVLFMKRKSKPKTCAEFREKMNICAANEEKKKV